MWTEILNTEYKHFKTWKSETQFFARTTICKRPSWIIIFKLKAKHGINTKRYLYIWYYLNSMISTAWIRHRSIIHLSKLHCRYCNLPWHFPFSSLSNLLYTYNTRPAVRKSFHCSPSSLHPHDSFAANLRRPLYIKNFQE